MEREDSVKRHDGPGTAGTLSTGLKIHGRKYQHINFDTNNPPPLFTQHCFLLKPVHPNSCQYLMHPHIWVAQSQQMSPPTPLVPVGEFAFVRMLNGEIRVSANSEGHHIHLQISGYAEAVGYAGVVTFSQDHTGEVIYWGNRSSGYPGTAAQRTIMPFPDACFVGYDATGLHARSILSPQFERKPKTFTLTRTRSPTAGSNTPPPLSLSPARLAEKIGTFSLLSESPEPESEPPSSEGPPSKTPTVS